MKPEQQVHVVHGLTRCAFQQIVDNRNNQQFAIFFRQIQKTFVCVHHIFQIRHAVADKREIVIVVVFIVEFLYFRQLHGAVHVERGKNAARETSAHRNKIHFAVETCLHAMKRLIDFCQMLVGEWLINRNIVVAP